MLTARQQRNPWLEEITRFAAAGLTEHLASLIVCAYVTGCTVSQVLMAIEAGGTLGELPSAALRVARKAAQDWAWIAPRRGDAIVAGRPENPMRGDKPGQQESCPLIGPPVFRGRQEKSHGMV